jgi:hypothetical protein
VNASPTSSVRPEAHVIRWAEARNDVLLFLKISPEATALPSHLPPGLGDGRDCRVSQGWLPPKGKPRVYLALLVCQARKNFLRSRSDDRKRMRLPLAAGGEVGGVASLREPRSSGLTVHCATPGRQGWRAAQAAAGGADRRNFGKIALLEWIQEPLPRSGASQSTRMRVAVKQANSVASSRLRGAGPALWSSSRRATRPR